MPSSLEKTFDDVFTGWNLHLVIFWLVELFSTLLLLGESRFAMSSSSGGGPLTMSSRLEAAFSYLLEGDFCYQDIFKLRGSCNLIVSGLESSLLSFPCVEKPLLLQPVAAAAAATASPSCCCSCSGAGLWERKVPWGGRSAPPPYAMPPPLYFVGGCCLYWPFCDLYELFQILWCARSSLLVCHKLGQDQFSKLG